MVSNVTVLTDRTSTKIDDHNFVRRTQSGLKSIAKRLQGKVTRVVDFRIKPEFRHDIDTTDERSEFLQRHPVRPHVRFTQFGMRVLIEHCFLRNPWLLIERIQNGVQRCNGTANSAKSTIFLHNHVETESLCMLPILRSAQFLRNFESIFCFQFDSALKNENDPDRATNPKGLNGDTTKTSHAEFL